MGHIHLGKLPGSRLWKDVVALLDADAAYDDIIAQSAQAAERQLINAPNDPVFVEAARLLALIPRAARSQDFGRELRAIGLVVDDAPDLADLLLAVSRRLDHWSVRTQPSDFGELSRRALIATLSASTEASLPGLLDADAEDVRRATALADRPAEFAALARSFFGRLTSETLASWLDRTLSTQVGPEGRFRDAGERTDFDAALRQYCDEATRIIREFAVGWRAKTLMRDGTITSPRAAAFGAVAFRKINEELRRKRRADE